jgi:5-formyltetrahydrofolate cyclo-ligase
MIKKSEFRRDCIAKLKKLNRPNIYVWDKRVSNWLYRYIKLNRYRVVMLYIPLKLEINISDLIKKLRRDRIEVLVPFMEGKSFRLVKYRLPIKIKKFGVREPNISNNLYKKIDLSIVPVIGIDIDFRRVGFGKGFYDRFFSKNSRKIGEIIFVNRLGCISYKKITDHYDIEGDLYITPKKILINNIK